MALYQYYGLRGSQYIDGEIEANSEKEAEAELRTQKIIIRKVSLAKGKPKSKVKEGSKFEFEFSLGAGVKPQEIMIFTKQLSTMTRAGLPILETIEILLGSMVNKTFKRALKMIADDLQSGNPLSTAFEKHKKIFDSIYINMLKAGEASGRLDTFLGKLVESIEKREKVKSQIKTAMFYPGIVGSVALTVTLAMMMLVVPTFVEMYGSMGVELPAPTQIVINISEFIRDPLGGGVLAITTIAVVGVAIFLIKTNKAIQRAFHVLLLKIPFFSELILKAILARFALILSNLLSAGVSILEAMDIGITSTGNIIAKESIENVKRGVFSGQELSELFDKEKRIFPMIFTTLVKVGERTGTTDEMFGSIAKYYEEELDTTVGRLSSIIEPLMIVFMGIMIGGLLMALYAPIFNMGQVVS